MNIVHLIIIVILIALVIYRFPKQLSPACKYVNLGRGLPAEDMDVLLSRIEWANNFPNRTDYYTRFLLVGIIASFMSGLVAFERMPSAKIFLSMTFIIFACLIILNNFFTHHSDKFNNSYIQDNIRYIRKKLRLRRVNNLDNTTVSELTLSRHRNFSFATNLNGRMSNSK